MQKEILLLPGDGIGPEVCSQAQRIIEWVNANTDHHFTTSTALIGGIAYEETGSPFPDETLNSAKEADAILLGAVGGPQWEALDYSVRPERGLLGIRKELGLFANLRPAMVFDELVDASTLRPEVVQGLDILIVRELTGGIYFGQPRGVETLDNGDRKGVNSLVYTTPEIRRIAAVAADLAMKRGKKLCSVDKANVLEATELWREEVTDYVTQNTPEVELSHMYVDNASMQLVRNPKQFDVIVTTNMFGDILSDCAAMLTGSLGMLPSASMGEKQADGKQHALYEPVHGSAPDIAGQDIANPIATILSLQMMFTYSFDLPDVAEMISKAVQNVLAKGLRTGDIMQAGMQPIGTSGMGDAILAELDNIKLSQAA